MDAYLRSARVLSVNPVTITIIVAYDPYYNLLSAEGFKPQSSSDGSIAKENSVYCYINLEFQNKNKFDPSLVKNILNLLHLTGMYLYLVPTVDITAIINISLQINLLEREILDGK